MNEKLLKIFINWKTFLFGLFIFCFIYLIVTFIFQPINGCFDCPADGIKVVFDTFLSIILYIISHIASWLIITFIKLKE